MWWHMVMHRRGSEGGNWRMEWVASTLHINSELGVSSITTTDTHTLAAGSRLNWRPRRFKWTRPFRRKTKSGFCACAITFQTQSNTCASFMARVKVSVGKLVGINYGTLWFSSVLLGWFLELGCKYYILYSFIKWQSCIKAVTILSLCRNLFLATFEKLREMTMSVIVSVRLEKLGSHWIDFHEIWYLSIFRKSVKNIQGLKSDKMMGAFHEDLRTHRSSWMWNVSDKSCRKK
jgi:hypothetical protein